MKPAACGIGMLHWSRSRVRESLLKREAPKHGASVFLFGSQCDRAVGEGHGGLRILPLFEPLRLAVLEPAGVYTKSQLRGQTYRSLFKGVAGKWFF